MSCSPTRAYALIAAAIAALGAAVALAAIFFNPPALAAAIALILTVTLGLIPAINAALRSYEACRGAATSCNIGLSVNILGQAAAMIGIGSFAAALALQLVATGLLGSFFASWAAGALIAAGEALKWGGIAGLVAGIGILLGLATQLAAYVSCRDTEDRARPPEPGSSGGALTRPASEGRLMISCVERAADGRRVTAVVGRNPDGTRWRLAIADAIALADSGRIFTAADTSRQALTPTLAAAREHAITPLDVNDSAVLLTLRPCIAGKAGGVAQPGEPVKDPSQGGPR